MANHELYVVQGKTLDNIAGTMRAVLGVDKDAPIRFDEVANSDKTEQINADVEAQADLIAQIKTALEGKAAGGGLPDWDDDSPIIASGSAYVSTKNLEWELTEKGTFRWKFIEGVEGNNRAEIFSANAPSLLSESYKKIAANIKQVYFPDGVVKAEVVYAPNCERIRFPNTLTNTHTISGLTSIKELDLSGEFYTQIPDYHCSNMPSLEKVQLCPKTTILPRNGFDKCYSLKEINLENITNFAQACLDNDFSLTGAIVFNAGLTQIAGHAFRATNITSIAFQNSPDNLPTIANNAFTQCSGLKAIFCPWAEGAVANANGGATNATMYYNVTYDKNGNPIDENGNPIVLEV